MAASSEVDGTPPPSDAGAARTGASPELRMLGLGIAAIVAFAVVAVDWDSPLRTAIILTFLLFVPGLAIAELLGIRDPLQRVSIAIGASIALETLVATALLYAGAFSATATAGVVYGITCFVLLAAVRRHARGTPAAPRDPEPDGDAA